MLNLIKSIIETIEFKFHFRKVVVGVNREEKKVEIKNENYFYSIPLSNEAMMNLPSEDIGNLYKHIAYLNIKSALKKNPKEMEEFLRKYGPTVATTTASIVTVEFMLSADAIQTINIEHKRSMIPSDFIQKISEVGEEIKLTENVNVQPIEGKKMEKKINLL